MICHEKNICVLYMATTLLPLIATIVLFTSGVSILVPASKDDAPSHIVLVFGAMLIMISFFVNLVYK